jgi:ribosomal protein S9
MRAAAQRRKFEHRENLRREGFARPSIAIKRKKYGLKAARRAPQFSKR